jgi:hypothetical protein
MTRSAPCGDDRQPASRAKAELLPDRQANIETIPGARHIALPDTGHFAALEAPKMWRESCLTVPTERRPPSGSVRAGRARCRCAWSYARSIVECGSEPL